MVRHLIKHVNGSLQLNEDEIDIFDYPEGVIEHWEPTNQLPEFDTVSKLYIDIETYSNNQMVIDYISTALQYGKLTDADKPIVDFLVNQIDQQYSTYLMAEDYTEASYCNQIKEYLLKRFELRCYALDMESSPDSVSAAESLYVLCDFIDTHYDRLINQEDIDPKGALRSETGKIVLIGLANERGETLIIDCEQKGEVNGLLYLFNLIAKKKPTFLAHFNGFDFDLPFIAGRCEILKIKHPFWISPTLTVFRTSQLFGKPIQYNAFWCNHGETSIIDLFHQALAWDFVNRKLTKFSLKQVPIQLGLRSEERLTLSYQEMKACVESGDLTRLKEYLVFDLEDSKLLGDFLLPDIYYQREVLPHWNYQSLSTGGMGSKWNDILLTEYRKIDPYFDAPASDTKKTFEGGLVGGRAGLYRNVSKIDVASLYPSIMLEYQICSRKDVHKKALAILKYLRTERLKLKALAKKGKGTSEGRLANQRQGALKVMINSNYGLYGTQGKEFNDYEAAALVTGYGRAILKRMMSAIEEYGGKHCSVDTDGMYYTCSTLNDNREAHKFIQSKMPRGIELEYELEALAFYVPPTSDKDAEDGEGLRKNYIIITRDSKTGEIKVKANGKFRKRDKCVLEKTFTPGLVEAYLEGKHVEYYQSILTQLMLKKYDTNKLSVTRKIKVNEKRLVELGIGKQNEVVTIYKAPDKTLYGKRGQALKKVEVQWTSDAGAIDWNYYICMVDAMYKEFLEVPKY